MYSKLLAAAAGLLLLCSCGAASLSGTESLLLAPTLNQRQAEVSKALESTLPLRSIVYKYPQSGDHRSPFIFFDLSGDGRFEAIVFYSYLGDVSGAVRAKILTEKPDGGWEPFYDIPSQGSGVEFVQFERVIDKESYCMLIGWSGTGRQPSVMQINSMRGGGFPSEASASYSNYSIGDFDGDGLAEVVVISRDGSRGGLAASLLRGRGGRVETSRPLHLSSEAEAVLSLTSGRIDGSGAVYVDELLAGGLNAAFATEIIRVSAGDGLTLLCGGEAASGDEPEKLARSSYELTFRYEEIYCGDYDGDGIVEVPYPVPLPGTAENPEAEPIKLIRLMRFSGNSFDTAASAVINSQSGYLVYFPDRWLDNVAVERARESSEWRFRKWNPETFESAEELLRIRVSSAQDYLDMFEDYIPLESKGTVSYSAYIPQIPDESLGITENELRLMFRLLPP